MEVDCSTTKENVKNVGGDMIIFDNLPKHERNSFLREKRKLEKEIAMHQSVIDDTEKILEHHKKLLTTNQNFLEKLKKNYGYKK